MKGFQKLVKAGAQQTYLQSHLLFLFPSSEVMVGKEELKTDSEGWRS